MELNGKALLSGQAAGAVLHADVGLSFMGGVDAGSGMVLDHHHPLHGQSVAGKILAIPSGRGSCSGSLVLFELLMNGHAPAALVFCRSETILTLGVLIAAELFDRGIPVLMLDDADFAALASFDFARVEGGSLTSCTDDPGTVAHAPMPALDLTDFDLTARDEAMLTGSEGEAAELAMRIILHTARLSGARSLVDVDMAHIDGCFYQGPAGLRFIRRLVELGGRVKVPATMNAICVDRKEWRSQGVAEALGLPSDDLADAYVAMGVAPSYTCAPYLLDPAPKPGQNIAWGESNAVVFANSVLSARTLKYPDYLDILVALTGRAPASDCYLDEHRRPKLRIDLPALQGLDDAFFPTLGYLVGKLSPNEVPIICGLERAKVSHDDLKAFGAAFATTSAAAMFHIRGITPEALDPDLTGLPAIALSHADLAATWDELNTATTPEVDLVSLGNPHFSLTEIRALARLCLGRRKHPDVALVVTCGREVMEQARSAGLVDQVRAFGGQFLNDTCWCFIGAPIVSGSFRAIATNSGKYAHYGPAAVGKPFHFASLATCVEAAATGAMPKDQPVWLNPV
ncbi:aconitase X [Tabrizicola sp.]|uniref:cis-3-hydroxy-L-proline dehydratase n=1 Tax=Tabrizicola sp. TaxID=2005166 RepID=UPI0035AFB28F